MSKRTRTSDQGLLKSTEGLAGLSRRDEQLATRALERAVGGREAVRQAIALTAKTPAAETLHAFLADPRNDRVALTDLCRRANVSVPALWSLFKDGAFSKAQIAALAQVANGLPAVAGDVMARAVEHQVRCAECYGRGYVGLPQPGQKKTVCRVCQGKKTIAQVPELKRQELALEIGGLLQRDKGGVHVNVNQEAALQVANVERSFADVQRDQDAILFPQRPTLPTPEGDVSS